VKRRTLYLALFIGVIAGGMVLWTGPSRVDPQNATVAELRSYCNAVPVSALTPAVPDVVKCREVGREIASYVRHGDIDCDLDSDDVYTAIRRTLIAAPDNRLGDEAALYIIERWLEEGTRCRRVDPDA